MKKQEHMHPSSPQIECDKCGGEVKVLNASYPRSYLCMCRKCKHKFNWTAARG